MMSKNRYLQFSGVRMPLYCKKGVNKVSLLEGCLNAKRMILTVGNVRHQNDPCDWSENCLVVTLQKK